MILLKKTFPFVIKTKMSSQNILPPIKVNTNFILNLWVKATLKKGISWTALFEAQQELASRSHLDSAVEKAAVLSRLVQQAFGGGQGQHAPRLIDFSKIAPGFPQELYPRHFQATSFALKLRIIYLCEVSDDKLDDILNCLST